ncbi:hypothetical protein FM21_01195 [Streptomyces mutabilis]|uniref:DUF397 domain-containing protein n=2 Tax=Streptomyces mutabilis TaxID=67332 RepID=A0A086N0Z1_9ACTN|nr:DUF397 domain-containing protein [Streptomyces mutabilis]KFG74809.1 hypothetical protein FM21_01195 [Streptomyces mutabilis]
MTDRMTWFKSSYSDDEGAACVEVALAPTIRIRDSKTAPIGPELHVSAPAWSAFITAVKRVKPL